MSFTRKVTGVFSPVTNYFQYEITPDKDNPAAVEEMPTFASITFDAVAPDEAHEAKSSTLLNLERVKFSRVGVYKFIVKEKSSSDRLNYPVDEAHSFAIVARVRNIINERNEPTGEFSVDFSAQLEDCGSGSKVGEAVFSTRANRDRIVISSSVLGDAGDTAAYFKIYVTISESAGLKNGDIFTLRGQDADVVYGGQKIKTAFSIKVGEKTPIYIKHGQTVTIGSQNDGFELPIGTSYSFNRFDSLGHDVFLDGFEYKSDYSKKILSKPAEGASTEDFSRYQKGIETKFEFKRTSNVLTGVMMNVLPFALLAVITIAALIAIYRRSSIA